MAPQCILGADASLLNNVFSALILSHCVLNLLGNEMGLAKVTNGLHVAKSHPKAWSSFHLLYCHLTEWNPPLHHETPSSPGCQNSRLFCLAFYLSGCPLSSGHLQYFLCFFFFLKCLFVYFYFAASGLTCGTRDLHGVVRVR